MQRILPPTVTICSIFAMAACVKVDVQPIKVEPIQVEITINHKIQRELDDFFADIDQASETTEYKSVEEASKTENP